MSPFKSRQRLATNSNWTGIEPKNPENPEIPKILIQTKRNTTEVKKKKEAQGSGDGKAERRRTMPCANTPDSSEYPTERFFSWKRSFDRKRFIFLCC